MAFEKGNKLGGRTPGAVGKSNAKTKEFFALLLENNLSKLQSDIDALEPKDRLKILIDLAGFVVPKMKSVENNIEVKQVAIPTINFTSIEA
jgi:hypothetical protein